MFAGLCSPDLRSVLPPKLTDMRRRDLCRGPRYDAWGSPNTPDFVCAGKLFKLDMSGFGLSCPFPQKSFAAFDLLESLDLSDNFALTVRPPPPLPTHPPTHPARGVGGSEVG